MPKATTKPVNKPRREHDNPDADPANTQFNAICHDMYKRFGGVFGTLKQICKTPEEKDLLATSLHVLRNEVRRLLEEARNA
jgi:hypothetical protein